MIFKRRWHTRAYIKRRKAHRKALVKKIRALENGNWFCVNQPQSPLMVSISLENDTQYELCISNPGEGTKQGERSLSFYFEWADIPAFVKMILWGQN